MRYLERGGVRLAWNESGSGAPILLIMGHRYSSAMWYPVIEGLGQSHRLIRFDNQGTGESGARRRTTIGEMTGDALAVLDAAGVDSAHVYGVSMGGGIALEFGIRHPERTRSLILGCTMAKTPEFAARRNWLHWLVYRLPAPVLRALSPKAHNNGYGDAAPRNRVERDLAQLAQDPFSRQGVWAQAVAIANYSVALADVEAMTKPALVLHGDQDLTVPHAQGRRLAELLPNAHFVTLEGAGHNYFVAQGDRANAEVERFIAEIEQTR